MPVYEFECEKGHRFSDLIPVNCREVQCLCECGETARRVVSRVSWHWEDGHEPKDTSAHDAWFDKHGQQWLKDNPQMEPCPKGFMDNRDGILNSSSVTDLAANGLFGSVS